MTARSTSRSRAHCCCPCGLALVVTAAAGTSWGDATPCYASHHMMVVLLYGLAHNTYPTLKPRHFFHTKTKICRTSGHTHRRSVFFFLHVAIRNSLRSNKTREKGTCPIGLTYYFEVYHFTVISKPGVSQTEIIFVSQLLHIKGSMKHVVLELDLDLPGSKAA